MALANAVDARTACPKASAATLKDNLAQVAELTSDALILDLASRLQRRLGRTSQPSAGRETEEHSAQDADRDDSDVDWWRDFVPAAVTKLPPQSEGRRPTGTEPEHLTTVRPEVQADGGTESPSGPSAKRTKREDSAVELETFTPLRTQREDSAADSDLETFAPLRTRSSTASVAWLPGRHCGAFLRRGPGGGVGPQAQVLLTNTYRNCESLPRAARVVLRDHIKPVGKMRRKVTFAAEMTSWLCGVAATTVQQTVVHVDAHGPSKLHV